MVVKITDYRMEYLGKRNKSKQRKRRKVKKHILHSRHRLFTANHTSSSDYLKFNDPLPAAFGVVDSTDIAEEDGIPRDVMAKVWVEVPSLETWSNMFVLGKKKKVSNDVPCQLGHKAYPCGEEPVVDV